MATAGPGGNRRLRVFDPSCGDGRFLKEARSRGVRELVGCDVDARAIEETQRSLGAASATLIRSDFFLLDPEALDPVDLIVGNPPFIRYQSFTGESRRRALESALRLGVRLSQLSSSWAPFLLHASRFLRPGGSLAMVVPAEITQTHYGLATLRSILGCFGRTTLIVFEENLTFADAQQETCLLLASDHGGTAQEVHFVPLRSVRDLESVDTGLGDHSVGVPLALGGNQLVRFAEAHLTSDERAAWRSCSRGTTVRSIGSLGVLTNGYVTGDNEFFHRSTRSAAAQGIPATWLRPALRTSRSLKGLLVTPQDVTELDTGGLAHHLVVPENDLFDPQGEALARFVAEGRELGVPSRFKCRTRQPWWRVPGLQCAEVVFAYMVGERPRAAVNSAGALYTNALHGLRVAPQWTPVEVAVAFHNSLTLLSLEIEGRSYGGGILKLEPREMEKVLVPLPEGPMRPKLATEVDHLLRVGAYADAIARVDQEILQTRLGLKQDDIALLRSARRRLMERRTRRGKKRPRNE